MSIVLTTYSFVFIVLLFHCAWLFAIVLLFNEYLQSPPSNSYITTHVSGLRRLSPHHTHNITQAHLLPSTTNSIALVASSFLTPQTSLDLSLLFSIFKANSSLPNKPLRKHLVRHETSSEIITPCLPHATSSRLSLPPSSRAPTLT